MIITSKDREFFEIIKDLTSNDLVNKMKTYRQHYDVSTYEHCLNVAYISYKICKKIGLDYVSMARAAMLHDLFLYDWREKKEHNKLGDWHAFKHPKIALENANKIYNLNMKETDIILKHMWPVTLALPKYKETYVITFADKYSAIVEGIKYYQKKNAIRKAYIYSCIISNILKKAIITVQP